MPALFALALVLVLFGAGLLLAALVASPRDPYAEKPWGCTRCRRTFRTQTEFFTHRDEVRR